MVSALIVLAFWAQGGFRFQINYTLFLISNYLVWFLLLPIIYELVLCFFREEKMKVWLIIVWILGLISSQWIISNVLLSIIKYLILGQDLLQDWREIDSYLTPSLIIRALDLTLFFGLLYWLHQQRVLTEKKLEVAESQTLLHQSKLQSLKSQLNPHFLFNALHIVNTQIGENDDKARAMTIKISQLLRKLLAINQLEQHTLQEELDFVDMYLDIEMERFSDRLTVEMDVSDDARKHTIPTMVLQPLIENAFKHGISKLEGKVRLQISIQINEGMLMLEVSNPCPEQSLASEREGIGLKNLRDRLQLYYGDTTEIAIQHNGSNFTAKLMLPI